ncbi:Envelope glycoprotein gp160 [Stylosanthes scabra]|uniref:Envelope glycoprotein gp160 n=1 Tax=Stylosanthes scabra TaxID=79078 RepID=A0ABU6ZM37_9FABA|nr:Envelope glycoprotein gp160 [Stylosanthes scabra]
MAPKKTLTYLAEQKTLESSFVRDEDESPKVTYNQFRDEIPVISLAGINDTDGRRAEICKQIVEACKDWRIFQVVDHDVDTKLISDMTRLAKEFFLVARRVVSLSPAISKENQFKIGGGMMCFFPIQFAIGTNRSDERVRREPHGARAP